MSAENLNIISIDIGTTQTKVVLYHHGEGIVGQETEQINAFYPKPGWAELDPEEIFQTVLRITQRLVQSTNVPPRSVAAIVFTGILQSLVPIDKTGHALSLASTWADRRSQKQNEILKRILDLNEVKRRTGCTLHPMYLPSRLAWIKENTPDIFQHADKFVSIKEFVIARLFGVYQVDYSIASGSGIWNMHTLDWDVELLSKIGLSSQRLSECVEPTTIFPTGLRREFADLLGLMEGTPGIIGSFDGAQSHLGTIGISSDRMSLSVGTSAAIRKNIKNPKVISGSEDWCYYLAEGHWLQGGVVHNAGNAIRWFADNLMDSTIPLEETFLEMNRLAKEIAPGSDGLNFLPYFGGERCPQYRPDARGSILGLTFSHGRAHMVRALMEGLAYQLYSVYRMLAVDTEPDLVVNGGILKSPVWLSIISDLFGKDLYLPGVQEATAWGGVLLGLRAIGELKSLDETSAYITTNGMQEPNPRNWSVYRNLIRKYDEIYAKIYS